MQPEVPNVSHLIWTRAGEPEDEDSSWEHETRFYTPELYLPYVLRARATTHAGVVVMRVDVMTAEVGGIVSVAGPCWTSKYIPAMGWPR